MMALWAAGRMQPYATAWTALLTGVIPVADVVIETNYGGGLSVFAIDENGNFWHWTRGQWQRLKNPIDGQPSQTAPKK